MVIRNERTSPTLTPSSRAFLRTQSFHTTPKSMRVVGWILLPFIVTHVVLASIAGYRAIVQVYRVGIDAPATLHVGDSVTLTATSSGRATVDVELELIQQAHAETLNVMLIETHSVAAYDPRPIHAGRTVVLTPEVLSRFHSGSAALKATANGRSQWMRIPPPVIARRAVELR